MNRDTCNTTEVTARWVGDISAKAGILADGTQVILLQTPGDDRAISLDSARSLASDLISALAQHGDATALAIGDQYFTRVDDDAMDCPSIVLAD